jgi:hypothetical protein
MSEEGDQSDPEILVFDGDGALVHEKLHASRVMVFPIYKGSCKKIVEKGHEGRWACTMRPGSRPAWCTLSSASWVPLSPSCAESPPFPREPP